MINKDNPILKIMEIEDTNVLLSKVDALKHQRVYNCTGIYAPTIVSCSNDVLKQKS